jgi:chloride channel protein, CIC family
LTMKTPPSDPDAHVAASPLATVAMIPPAGIADQEDRLPTHPMSWLLLMIATAIVGAVVGLVGGSFRLALQWAANFRGEVVDWSHANGSPWLSWAIPSGLCAFGAGLGCWLTQRLAPRTAGSGIPRVEAVLRSRVSPANAWILPVKFFGGILSIGSGLALGREGPTVQMGGTIGRLIGTAGKRIVPEPWTLIAAGAGAGLAVAFNAPLAAVVFVMEELLRRFSARVLCASLVASITGTVVLRMMLGNLPDFGTPRLGELPSDVLPEYVLLGVLCGLLGVAFNVTLLRTLGFSDRLTRWPKGAKGALVGALAGLLAWFLPGAVGGGDSVAQSAITNQAAWTAILSLLALRFVLTMASYATGAPGGIFAPLLAMGALLGNAFAAVNADLRHIPFDPSAFAIVGMAACFTAIVRCPITGVVLLLEMTGDWTLILPMMAASVTAYAIPELMGNCPIYDSLRARDERMEKKAH